MKRETSRWSGVLECIAGAGLTCPTVSGRLRIKTIATESGHSLCRQHTVRKPTLANGDDRGWRVLLPQEEPSDLSILLVFLCAVFVISLNACKEQVPEKPPPLYVKYTPSPVLHISDSTGIYAVVEIPAGTTELQAIDTSGHLLSISDHPVDFLPFPGNYGFIAGCGKMDSVLGKLVPLPVLVMMPSLQAQSIVGISPVATLVLSKDGTSYPIVIAIPADSTLQSIQAHNFVDFITEYDASRHILQQWFLNYQGREMFGFTGWRDEHYAKKLIADWKLKE